MNPPGEYKTNPRSLQLDRESTRRRRRESAKYKIPIAGPCLLLVLSRHQLQAPVNKLVKKLHTMVQRKNAKSAYKKPITKVTKAVKTLQ